MSAQAQTRTNEAENTVLQHTLDFRFLLDCRIVEGIRIVDVFFTAEDIKTRIKKSIKKNNLATLYGRTMPLKIIRSPFAMKFNSIKSINFVLFERSINIELRSIL